METERKATKVLDVGSIDRNVNYRILRRSFKLAGIISNVSSEIASSSVEDLRFTDFKLKFLVALRICLPPELRASFARIRGKKRAKFADVNSFFQYWHVWS